MVSGLGLDWSELARDLKESGKSLLPVIPFNSNPYFYIQVDLFEYFRFQKPSIFHHTIKYLRG